MDLCSRCRCFDLEQLRSESGFQLHDDWPSLTLNARTCRLCAWIVAETLADYTNQYHFFIDSQLSVSSSLAEYDLIDAQRLNDPLADIQWWSGHDTSTWIRLVTGADRKVGFLAHIGVPQSRTYGGPRWKWCGTRFELNDCRVMHVMQFFVFSGTAPL